MCLKCRNPRKDSGRRAENACLYRDPSGDFLYAEKIFGEREKENMGNVKKIPEKYNKRIKILWKLIEKKQ